MVFINDINPEIFNYGFIHIRWYGVFFLIGIILNYLVVRWAFRREKYPVADLDSCAVYLFIGLIVGARVGHIIFYEPSYYFSEPLRILQVWKGGLASHGAAIGVFLAYLLWVVIHKIDFKKYADIFVLGMPLTAMFVRIGNFFNSEIVGVRSGKCMAGESGVLGSGVGDCTGWGVIFKRLGEDFPRYPAQLFEAGLSLGIFVLMIFIYLKFGKRGKELKAGGVEAVRGVPALFYVFLYILLYFVGRFIIEFWKDLHGLPLDFPLSTGQVLSILPILLAGLWFGIFFPRRGVRK